MRALVAAAVAAAIVVFTAAPHVHLVAASGDDGACQVCVMRHAGAVPVDTVTLAPPAALAEAPLLAPRADPVSGAPLGAVPGQSPPTGA